MLDAALSSYDAQVVLATSSDENYPAENIIDGKTETFWISTGLFPQEFIIRFPDNMKIVTISIHSHNIKRLRIEMSTSEDADKFETIAETEFEHTESSLQTNDISVNLPNATHLRFIILSGYDHFVSVHKVSVQS
ncbi:intraflagellar transport protein 25 homolog [Triplophysa rosa]|uniref:Intraflagellar transport protein 25 homolog n=1 Tax=Triplophysa rosa TaxID=992332 RepID=A0A9W8CAH1_TRIRA|nr:intraflagellar transport protein 25 homolog [Triplophysa rosa]KAI7813025.1 intraflagellar transport protein 25-like protein [Triplophysa rosa]